MQLNIEEFAQLLLDCADMHENNIEEDYVISIENACQKVGEWREPIRIMLENQYMESITWAQSKITTCRIG